MNRSVGGAVFALLGLASCADPTALSEAEGVRVASHWFGLTIHNHRQSAIYYAAFDQELVARIEWVGCGWRPVADPVRDCGPGVVPGENESVPAGNISGWGDSPRAVVYWWSLAQTADGRFRQDSIRALVVDVR